MKKFFLATLALSFLLSAASAQSTNYSSNTKGELVGLQFNLIDFITPTTWGNSSSPRQMPGFRDVDYGFSFGYWKGLKPKIDLAVKLNAMFHNYAGDRVEATTRTEIGLELEPSINVHALEDNNFFSPYLTLGLGMGVYTGKFAAYVPVGVGIQFNFNSLSYFMIQANYKASLNQDKVNNNLVYSLGIAQTL